MNLPLDTLTPRQHYELYGYYANALVTAAPDCRHVAAPAPLAVRVRRQLANLHCEELAKVEGVTLMRTGNRKKPKYFIDGTKYTLEAAVREVIARAGERREVAGETTTA